MKILKKITLKDLNNLKAGVLKAAVAGNAEPIFVARIIGLVRGLESVPTAYGAALKFKGEFQAFGMDGEEARGVVAYVPSPFDEMLAAQVREIQGEDGNAKVAVEFGLDVFAVEDKGETGYKYVVKPLKEAAPSDPLKALTASFAPLALAAPKAEAAPALEHQVEEPAETPKAGAKKK